MIAIENPLYRLRKQFSPQQKTRDFTKKSQHWAPIWIMCRVSLNAVLYVFLESFRVFTETSLVLIIICSLVFGLMGCTPAVDEEINPTNLTTSEAVAQTPGHSREYSSTPDVFSIARLEMVSHQIEARGIEDPEVLIAMRNVPRHEFVLNQYLDLAYSDQPLPIHAGQTISQPYIVALMTALLEVTPGDRVLEIGTGSGYQAAVLAEMGVDVHTVEIIPELAQEAQERLTRLGYPQIQILNADGYNGWLDYAPYQAIIVTAAPDHLPQPLINQLAEGGRLIIPIGPIGAVQTLWLFEKIEGDLQATNMGGVRFVPLTGDH
jgi:protein-L-isoaspartate(D-aspartate) O-methyltransferase